MRRLLFASILALGVCAQSAKAQEAADQSMEEAPAATAAPAHPVAPPAPDCAAQAVGQGLSGHDLDAFMTKCERGQRDAPAASAGNGEKKHAKTGKGAKAAK